MHVVQRDGVRGRGRRPRRRCAARGSRLGRCQATEPFTAGQAGGAQDARHGRVTTERRRPVGDELAWRWLGVLKKWRTGEIVR